VQELPDRDHLVVARTAAHVADHQGHGIELGDLLDDDDGIGDRAAARDGDQPEAAQLVAEAVAAGNPDPGPRGAGRQNDKGQ
jgi:hypothetical protein